jgi:hypothetical protein
MATNTVLVKLGPGPLKGSGILVACSMGISISGLSWRRSALDPDRCPNKWRPTHTFACTPSARTAHPWRCQVAVVKALGSNIHFVILLREWEKLLHFPAN